MVKSKCGFYLEWCVVANKRCSVTKRKINWVYRGVRNRTTRVNRTCQNLITSVTVPTTYPTPDLINLIRLRTGDAASEPAHLKACHCGMCAIDNEVIRLESLGVAFVTEVIRLVGGKIKVWI